MLLVLRFPLFSRSQGSQDSFEVQQNSGKRRASDASDAPNCSHRRFDFFKVPVARIWRFRGLIGSTFSTFLALIFHGFSMIAFFQKIMKNVEPVTPRKRQTRATAIFSYLRRRLGAILGGFWEAKTRPRRLKMAPRWRQDGPRWRQDGPR